MKSYHTTKTIFGKDQRIPPTGYISYPALSASLTHYIRSLSAYFNVDARKFPRVFPMRVVTLVYFPRNRGRFEKVIFASFCACFQHTL